MSDYEKILLTASLTILGGFLIQSASQIFLKIFVEPIQEFKKNKSEAISLLIFHSNMLEARLTSDESEEYRERYWKAQDEIRKCMASIKASYYSITPIWLAVILRIAPKQSNFKIVSSNLLTLSFLGSLKADDDPISKNRDLAKDTLQLLGAEW